MLVFAAELSCYCDAHARRIAQPRVHMPFALQRVTPRCAFQLTPLMPPLIIVFADFLRRRHFSPLSLFSAIAATLFFCRRRLLFFAVTSALPPLPFRQAAAASAAGSRASRFQLAIRCLAAAASCCRRHAIFAPAQLCYSAATAYSHCAAAAPPADAAFRCQRLRHYAIG